MTGKIDWTSLRAVKPHVAHARDALFSRWDAFCFPGVFKKILPQESAVQQLNRLLMAGTPLAVARMGRTEARILGEWHYASNHFSSKSLKQAHVNAGIFPVEVKLLSAFASIYWQALQQLDVLAFWPTEYQAQLVNELDPCPVLIDRVDLEPFFSPQPWTSQLLGKKVLVVHPFKDSILRQYSTVRQKLFPGTSVLPPFDLQVIRAPQCSGSATAGYASWLDAFFDLEAQVRQANFDVAIVGCGAFGLPLVGSIKTMGRMGIHMAGSTQLLFGIQGQRWMNEPSYERLWNKYWVRPMGSELLPTRNLIEDACYW
jgi:hypothetical protein